MDRTRLVDLVEASDLDGLVRFVDGLVTAHEWDGLVEVRDRCLEATIRGKQVWGAAHFAEYRLALDAPGPYAGPVVVDGAGRFALGPLWEVAASTHGWSELEPHLPAGASRTMVAHERAVRGEDLTGADGVSGRVLEVPLRLEPWEPRYPVAVYRSDRADFPEHEGRPLRLVELPAAADQIDDPAVTDALADLVLPWVDQSNGRCVTVAVDGPALGAVRALGARRATAAEVDLGEALAAMTWAGASGGAYGRRRGTPVGRAAAWWVVAAMAGLDVDWPVAPDGLADAAAGLRWWLWDPGDQAAGWRFHLAAELPDEGVAWAVSAVDAV